MEGNEEKPQNDTGWWNEGDEFNTNEEKTEMSKPRDENQESIEQTHNEESFIESFLKLSVVAVIVFVFLRFLDSLGLPIWEILHILFIIFEILEFFF